jgi:hypothetical protein
MEKEELERILKMVGDGTMKPEDAARLIEALQGKSAETESKSASVGKAGANWVVVKVTDIDSGKTRVNVRLPLWIVEGMLRFGGDKLNIYGMSGHDVIERFKEMVASDETGKLLDVTDEKDRERVEIVIL